MNQLLIGKTAYSASSNEYKQVLLSGQYALLAIITLLFYAGLEIYNGKASTLFLYLIAIAIIGSTLFLHHRNYHSLSNYILFPVFNLVVYLIASSEDLSTGACLFFMPVALGSVAIFNYSHKNIAIGFTIFSFLLCVLTLKEFSILPYRYYTEAEMKLSLMINFIIAFPVSMMAIYLLIRMSHYNAMQLLDNNKQMLKLNEELDRFVYSTSHDLRAPLLSVMGLLKLAENGTPSETKLYHQMMYKRINSLDKFIKDITDYSRNNRLLVEKENVQPARLLNEIWESLCYSEDAQGITFINDIPNDQCLISDNARLRVVLSNLISNAIRYHDHKKEDKFIRVSLQTTEKSLLLRVEDNGQGIAKELQLKVFDMFFRGNETSQGSGLGLYIVRETLDKLAASITLSSTPTQGSTFSICFPTDNSSLLRNT